MLATQISTGTWVAIGTLVILMLPVYISSLKAAQGYGRLEQKVDNLTIAHAQAQFTNSKTQELLATTLATLTGEFQGHAVADAGHFGELRGLLGAQPTKQV